MRPGSGVRSKVFYGWWLVLVCLLIQAIATGASIYSFSIFAGEIEAEFTASRALVMLAMTGQGIMTAVAAPILGTILDRASIRWTMVVTALVMGLGFWAISLTPSAWGFVAAYTLLVSLGLAALGMLSASVLLSRWFLRHRGLAIGIAALGTQLGGFTIPPLLASLIEAFDWRFAAQAIGLFVAIVIPLLAYWTIVDYPADRGLAPDGDPLRSSSISPSGDADLATGSSWLSQILADRNFWLIGLGIAVLVAMFTTILGSLSLFARDIGTPREQAALLVSLYAVVGMVFSPIIGRLCDLVDTRWVFAGLVLVSMVAMAAYLTAQTYTGLAIATAIVAISGGGLTPCWSALIGQLFDLRLYARAMGAVALLAGAVGASAPVMSGWLFDLTGNYRSLFIALIALMTLSLFAIALIHNRTTLAVEA